MMRGRGRVLWDYLFDCWLELISWLGNRNLLISLFVQKFLLIGSLANHRPLV